MGRGTQAYNMAGRRFKECCIRHKHTIVQASTRYIPRRSALHWAGRSRKTASDAWWVHPAVAQAAKAREAKGMDQWVVSTGYSQGRNNTRAAGAAGAATAEAWARTGTGGEPEGCRRALCSRRRDGPVSARAIAVAIITLVDGGPNLRVCVCTCERKGGGAGRPRGGGGG